MEIIQAKKMAEGPHILHIERALRPKGANSKKLSTSILTAPPDAKLQDMLLEPIIKRRCEAAEAAKKEHEPDLLKIVMPNEKQRESILQQATILAAQSLVKHTPGFKEYENDPLFQLPRHRQIPEEHRTKSIPVASSVGEQFSLPRFIALIRDTYVNKLHLDEKTMTNRAIPCINDTVTNLNIRRALTSESTSDADQDLLACLQLGPGLNDILRKMVSSLIKLYCPKGPDSQGGLFRLFAITGKAHLALARPQDHDAAVNALEVVVESSFLDCWRINCGHDSVAAYAESNPKPQEILALARKIVIKHAKRVVPKQPQVYPDDSKYSDENSDKESNDQVYTYHRLLLRDAIYVVLMKRAIGDGDFGRIEDFLGVVAVSLMGAGMENTCFEIMHFIQDLKNVWSEPFGNIMRDSMIVNYFKQVSNAMPADTSLPNLAAYSKYYYAMWGWEDEWTSPKTMAEAIALIDRFDEKMTLKKLTEQMGSDSECCVM